MRRTLVLGAALLALFAWMWAGSGAGPAYAGGAKEKTATPEAGQQGQAGGALQDGTYTATYATPDERGWNAQMEIVVENGKITQVNYDEVNAQGQRKSTDQDYAQRMQAETGITPSQAQQQLESGLLERQSADQVDTVTGATGTSQEFKQLAAAAIDAARQGQQAQVVLQRRQ